jgi:AcrR family transcriptional regulator
MAPRSPNKETAIIEAAQRQFMQHGYRRTSIEDIAEEAKIAKGTVYLYFDSKEAVFRGVSRAFIGWFLGKARAAAKLDGTVEQRVTAVLSAKFAAIHALSSRSPFGSELVDSSHSVGGDLYRDADKAYVKVLATVLKDAGPRLKPIDAAWMIFRAAQGVEFSVGSKVTPAEVQKRLAELAAVMVRGLKT